MGPFRRDPDVGDVVGDRYRIEAVRRGGMGIVYEVCDSESGAVLAIKTLQQPAISELRERFEEEAFNWIAAPRHDNVVSAFQVFIEDDRLFLIMEYVDGGSLAERLCAGPLPRETAIEFACQLCLGMAALSRSREIAHLDLKPANLLLTRDGVLKITDFGLVKVTTAFSSRPAHEAMGTYRYASPEQLLGEVVDTRSDIFSFGVLFYEMLTGASPYPVRFTGDATLDSQRLHLLHRILRHTEALTPQRAAQLGVDAASIGDLLEWDRRDGHSNPLGLRVLPATCPVRELLSDTRPRGFELDAEVGPVVAECLAEYGRDRYATFADLGRKLARIAPPRLRRPLETLREADAPPRDPGQAFLLAVSCQNLERHEQAVDHFNRFLCQVPPPDERDRAEAYRRAARSYDALGMVDIAARCREQAGERAGPPAMP